MTLQRMDHVGTRGRADDAAMLQTPDGNGRLELIRFHSPPAQGDGAPAPGQHPGPPPPRLRREDIHAVVDGLRARGTELVGDLVRHGDSYWLCCVRGPDGIIVELAEKIS